MHGQRAAAPSTAVAAICVSATMIGGVKWLTVLRTALLAGILSVLNIVAGLSEVKKE